MKQLLFLFAVIESCVLAQESVTFVEPATLPETFMIANTDQRLAVACIDSKLLQCKSSFNWYLNITDDADWRNPDVLIHLINSFYDKGVDGVLALCNARTMFQQCLGQTYTACLQPTKFLSQGSTLDDAWKYIGTMRELEFQCNGGFLQTISQWDCLRSMDKVGDDAYQQCKQTFQNVTAKDPSLTCAASVDFSNCARAPYFIGCGADASWWECERVRVSLNLDQACPANLCAFDHFLEKESKTNKYLSRGAKLASMNHVPPKKMQFLANRMKQIEKRMAKQEN